MLVWSLIGLLGDGEGARRRQQQVVDEENDAVIIVAGSSLAIVVHGVPDRIIHVDCQNTVTAIFYS